MPSGASYIGWREGVRACLELVEQKRAFFLADYEDLVQKRGSYYWPLNARRVAAIEETLERREGRRLTATLRLEATVYSNLVPELIRYWIKPNGFPDVEDYVTFWLDCVPRGLYEALDPSDR